MKKALIVLLILAVAGGLFAVDISGKVSTGINFALTDEDIPVSATEPVKAELNFTGGGDDWGAKIGTSATRLDGSGLSVGDAFGWVNFGDIFTLSAGTGRGGWGTAGPWEGSVDEALGVKLEVKPIAGLNFGIRLGFPNDGVKANKLANFFQETGIGVTYGADAFSIAAGVNLYSEETTGVAADPDDPTVVPKEGGLDASFYAGFQYTGLSFVTISVDGGMDNAMKKGADESTAYLGEKFSGDVSGLGWEVWSKQKFTDPLSVTAGAKLTYGFDLTDAAHLGLEAGADLTIMDEFNFDDVYAKVNLDYKFNGNVSTGFEFKLTDTMEKGKDADIAAYLKWTIGFSF